MIPAVLAADGELASAAARKPADTAASWQDTGMQAVVADTLSALETVAEVYAAGALHADTAASKHFEVVAVAVAVVAAAVVASVDGEDVAGYSWVLTGQSHGVWVVRIAEM